jgi:hypothetical protein
MGRQARRRMVRVEHHELLSRKRFFVRRLVSNTGGDFLYD